MPTQARPAGARQFFARHGALSKWHPGYEFRAGQVEMAQAVESALADKRHLIVEAGTGKTLAYLVPACSPASASWFPRAPRTSRSKHDCAIPAVRLAPVYPCLRETVGSIFMAMRAGRMQATRATAARSKEANANDAASLECT